MERNMRIENDIPRKMSVSDDAMEQTTYIVSRLREERKKSGVSQVELAERCGMLQSSVARIESQTTSPMAETLARMASALNLRLTVEPVLSPVCGEDDGWNDQR